MSRAARFGMWFGFWTLVGVFFSMQLYFIEIQLYRSRTNVATVLIASLPDWYLWGLFTPLILFLGRRFPIERRNWMWRIPLHVAAGLIIAAAQIALYSWLGASLRWPINGLRGFVPIFSFLASVRLNWLFVVYCAMIAGTQAMVYYRRAREREALLAKAELQALKSQLHPHFLFNSLHATMALIRKDPAAAEKMIIRLSELLRATLESSGTHEVPLQQEIRFLEQYLEIERTRFADRLQIHMNIDPTALDVKVPNMILQPLVENAVKHGISPRAASGNIHVKAARANGHLHLEVCDDGAGLNGKAIREGIGLSNTRARLRQLYGKDQQFEVEAPATGGFTARVTIPVRS